MTGEAIDADEALRIGLVFKLAKPDQLLAPTIRTTPSS